MKFLVMGDVHAHIKLFAEIVNKTDCDAVLQCGDLGVWSLKDFTNWGYVEDKHGHYEVYGSMAPITDVTNSQVKFNKPVYFITGNHENFDLFDMMRKNGEFDGRWNLNYVSYDRPQQIDKVRVSGISGCYSYKVYTGGIQKGRQMKVKPETPADVEAYLNSVMGRDARGRFKAKEVETVKKQKSDILLLHELPMGVMTSGELPIKNEIGCSALNDTIKTMKPKYCFCGHFHRIAIKEMWGTKVVVLPDILKGYVMLDTKDWSIEWRSFK